MPPTAARALLWTASIGFIAVVNAIDIWSGAEVREWIFGQSGAAWVQAIGSIAAIIGAYVVAQLQISAQNAAAREAIADQRRQAVETLKYNSSSAAHAIKIIRMGLMSRDLVHAAADGGFRITDVELDALENRLNAFPAYAWPVEMTRLAVIIAATVRQFRGKVNDALRHHRSMDALAFEDFFETLGDIERAIQMSAEEVDALPVKL